MARFKIVEQFDIVATNTQGICLDDDYFYISEASELMKYTRSGNFVARHDTTGDGSSDHLGDCMIKDGVIYVTSSLYPSGPPYNEVVMLYDAETLTYITEYSTFTDHIGEGIDYRLGKFWTVSDNFDNVYSWDEGFVNPTTYPILMPNFTGSVHHLQTIVWASDSIVYMQVHGGPSPAYPETVLKYEFDGDSFNLLEEITRPVPIYIHGQGMAWDHKTKTMYFANRDDINTPDSVTGAKIVDDKFSFVSDFPIDKIVTEGTITIENDGDTGTAYNTAKIVQETVTNTYGRAGLMRARWSIDGGANWQGMDTELTYTFTLSSVPGNPGHPVSDTLFGLDSALSVGCQDSQLVFRTANGRHGNVSNLTSPVYTPTSRTFIIQYALYEVE